jgi:hypothetical protein
LDYDCEVPDVKRYLLFTYEDYYPGGGWSDFRGSFDTPEDAMEAAVTTDDTYAELIDRETLQEVEFKYEDARQKHHQQQTEFEKG